MVYLNAFGDMALGARGCHCGRLPMAITGGCGPRLRARSRPDSEALMNVWCGHAMTQQTWTPKISLHYPLPYTSPGILPTKGGEHAETSWLLRREGDFGRLPLRTEHTT